MLDSVLMLLAERLNSHFLQKFDLDESIAQLGAPIAPDGVMPIEASDKILIFLTNINRETLPNQPRFDGMAGAQTKPPLYLNLTIAVAANFRPARYIEGLKFLSQTIYCLHQTNVIDKSVHADMPTGISKLLIDIENTTLPEESNLWGILGGKYLPSVLYKVRMLTISSNTIVGHESSVSAPERLVGR